MSDKSQAEDIALMQRIEKKDQSAISDLYQRYQPLIYSMAFNVLRNRTLAEEVTQDIFVQVWQTPKKWDPNKGKLSSWLMTVTRYTAIDRLRKEQRQPPVSAKPLETLAHLLPSGEHGSDALRDNSRLLRQLIQELPKEQRQMIYLAFFRGMTHTDIAKQHNIPLGTVKSRIRLGLSRLKDGWKNALKDTQD